MRFVVGASKTQMELKFQVCLFYVAFRIKAMPYRRRFTILSTVKNAIRMLHKIIVQQ